MTLPDGTKIEYVIDAANRRVGKKVNGKLVQGFLWQAGSGQSPSWTAREGRQPLHLCRQGQRAGVHGERAARLYRIVTDHLGSPRLVIDMARGDRSRLDYDEFGNVLPDTNPGFQPFGFAGGFYDPQTKLIRFGRRDYDAQSGSWLARDPFLFSGRDANLYRYASSEPVNQWTPPVFGQCGVWERRYGMRVSRA